MSDDVKVVRGEIGRFTKSDWRFVFGGCTHVDAGGRTATQIFPDGTSVHGVLDWKTGEVTPDAT